MIKLVAIDLDDTLLDSKQRISDECKTAIIKARQKGVLVTLATGRMYESALPYAKELEIDIPLITYQGALVKYVFSEEVIYYRTIPKHITAEVVNFLSAQDIYFLIYANNSLYITSFNHHVKKYAQITRIKPQIVPDFNEIIRNYPVIEIMAIIEEQSKVNEVYEKLSELYGNVLHISPFKQKYIEIMDSKATKAHALEVIADYKGIKREEVMAIGDNYNDISMLKWAGIGVAMGNADEVIKQAADYVTLSNDEKGVAEALKKFVISV